MLLTKEKIKEIRIKVSATQEAFARKLNISLQTVRRYEYGQSYPMPIIEDRIVELAKENKVNI